MSEPHSAARLAAPLAVLAILAGCAARPLPDIPVAPFSHWFYADGTDPGDFGALPDADARADALALWQDIRTGRLGAAARLLADLEAQTPKSAENVALLALAGYLDIRRGRLGEAETHFARAVQLDAADPFALLGPSLLALEQNDHEAALVRLRRLEAAAPDAPVVVERLPGLTLDVAESRLGEARRLAREGNATGDQVVEAYRNALELIPEAGDLHLEAADAARAAGAPGAARDWYDLAASGSSAAGETLGIRVAAAEAALAAGDAEGAANRLRRLESHPEIDRFPDIRERTAELSSRIERARLPAAYRRIRESERVSREELAALLAGELGSREASAPVIAIDIERSWAAGLIRDAVAAGYLSLFPDHTFQPRGLVHRTALAESLARALRVHDPQAFREAARASRDRRFSDLAETHPQRDAAAIAVELGLLEVEGGDRFAAREFASGAEAVRAVFALRDLLGRSP